jgi:hypothetical protein
MVSVTDYTYSPTSATAKALAGTTREQTDYIQSTLHQNHSDLLQLDNEWESTSDSRYNEFSQVSTHKERNHPLHKSNNGAYESIIDIGQIRRKNWHSGFQIPEPQINVNHYSLVYNPQTLGFPPLRSLEQTKEV